MMDNKIAILINWPREIDMYYQLIKSIPSHRTEIIVNNIKSIERGRNKLSKVIEKILERKKIKYKLFSNIYKKKKYVNTFIITNYVHMFIKHCVFTILLQIKVLLTLHQQFVLK